MSLWFDSSLSAIPLDGYTAVKTKNIRIRPTRLGISLIIACLLLWILAVNYQVNIIYVLVFLLLAMIITGIVAGLSQLKGIVLKIEPEKEYFADKPINLTVRIISSAKYKRWLWFYTGEEDIQKADNWQLWAISEHNLTFQWTLPPQKRGYLPSFFLPCVTTAPFGLLRIETLWCYDEMIMVYPNPIQHVFSSKSVTNDGDPTHIADLNGEDLAFLRPHQNGVSLRQIAWKHYAKNQQLMDKYFNQQQKAVQHKIISYQDYPSHTNKDYLAGLLCYRILTALAQGESFILELPHQKLKLDALQRTKCLDALGKW